MALFLCRWPNGDCSVVWARSKDDEETGGGAERLLPDRRAAIGQAVEQERRRLERGVTPTAEPRTQVGRDLQEQTDLPTVLVDRLVDRVATTTLTRFKGRTRPS
jgi:hypothetical protein